MHWTFENIADGELTQVALWTAYKDQFEHADPPNESRMLNAADVIKHTTEAYSNAVPMVTPERKFIIKGIRIRDRAGSLSSSLSFSCE